MGMAEQEIVIVERNCKRSERRTVVKEKEVLHDTDSPDILSLDPLT
jgi:hypothetical protein